MYKKLLIKASFLWFAIIEIKLTEKIQNPYLAAKSEKVQKLIGLKIS